MFKKPYDTGTIIGWNLILISKRTFLSYIFYDLFLIKNDYSLNYDIQYNGTYNRNTRLMINLQQFSFCHIDNEKQDGEQIFWATDIIDEHNIINYNRVLWYHGSWIKKIKKWPKLVEKELEYMAP